MSSKYESHDSLLADSSRTLEAQSINYESNVITPKKSWLKLFIIFSLALTLVGMLALVIFMSLQIRDNENNHNSINPYAIAFPISVTQVSVRDAILAGLYDGNFTIGLLKTFGTFGVGTFNGLDGDLVALDGEFMRFASNEVTHPADDHRVPFAIIANGLPSASADSDSGNAIQWSDVPAHLTFSLNSTSSVVDYIDQHFIKSQNHMYAIRIYGVFAYMDIAVSQLQAQPYQPFLECVLPRLQHVILTNVRGTVVGFRSPSITTGLNETVYLLHFISDDQENGGFVFSFVTGQNVQASIMQIDDIQMILPQNDVKFDQLVLPYKPAASCPSR